jgi:hypothetical protein
MMEDAGGVMRKRLCLAAIFLVGAAAVGCSLTVPIFPPGVTLIAPPSCDNIACDDAATDGAPEPDAPDATDARLPTTPPDPTQDPTGAPGRLDFPPLQPGPGGRSVLSP